ncbi:ParA family protein [Zhurongbacter thermophilus]
MAVISIANQKGGVGKTTLTVNLAAALTQQNKKVLVVDTDPQGNATTSLIGLEDLETTLLEIVMDNIPPEEAVITIEKSFGNMYLLPAPPELALANIEIEGTGNLSYMKEILEQLKHQFDYILIDTPPSVSSLMLASLIASDGVIVPLQAEFLALEGLSQMWKLMETIRNGMNPFLELIGVVINMWDPRTILARQVLEEVKRVLGNKAFDIVIPRTVRVAEAPSHALTLLEYAPESKATQAFLELANEVDSRCKAMFQEVK